MRGTAVLTTGDPAPLRVMTLWIDCEAHVFQVGSGRQYDAEGRQVALTPWAPNQPVPAGTGVAKVEAALCAPEGPSFTDLPVVADYGAALQRSSASTASRAGE